MNENLEALELMISDINQAINYVYNEYLAKEPYYAIKKNTNQSYSYCFVEKDYNFELIFEKLDNNYQIKFGDFNLNAQTEEIIMELARALSCKLNNKEANLIYKVNRTHVKRVTAEQMIEIYYNYYLAAENIDIFYVNYNDFSESDIKKLNRFHNVVSKNAILGFSLEDYELNTQILKQDLESYSRRV